MRLYAFPVFRLVALPPAVFLLSVFSLRFVGHTDVAPTLWFSNAVMLAAALRHDASIRQTSLLLGLGGLAILLADVASGFGPLLSCAFAIADVAEVGVAVWLMRRISSAGLDVTRGYGPFVLALAPGVLAPLVGASLSSAAVLAASSVPPLPVWSMVYTVDALGLLIVTPVALGLRFTDWRMALSDSRVPEVLTFAVAITVVSLVALNQRTFLLLLVPIAIIAAFRFGTGGAAMASAISGIVAIIFVVGDFGTPALLQVTLSERLLGMQLILAATVLVSTAVAAALSERDRVLQEASQAMSRAEAQTRLALDAAEIGTWNLDLTAGHLVLSDRAKSILGIPIMPEPSLDVVANSIYPKDRGIFQEGLARCLADGGDHLKVEYRAGGINDSLRWVRSWGRLDRDPTGRGLRIQGVLQDITWQKRAALERDDLLRRIIEAAELERFRLAHELHDQTGQDIAAIMMELGGIEPLVDECIRDRVHRLRSRLDQVSATLHRVAWELRPASLDELGLSRAIATYVSEWSDQCGVTADFYCGDNDADSVPEAIGIVIFRVVQEALTNIVKHAKGASWASVVIRREGPLLLVAVEDNGCGFDLKLADRHASGGGRPALGLVGMRERLALIGGEIEVESSQGAGTTVFARIKGFPLSEAV